MGIKHVYTCDEPGCDATRTFGSTSNLRHLTRGEWLSVPQIGGVKTYWPTHRAKHELKSLAKKFGKA